MNEDVIRFLLDMLRLNAQINVSFLKMQNRFYSTHQSGYYKLFFLQLDELEKLLYGLREERNPETDAPEGSSS